MYKWIGGFQMIDEDTSYMYALIWWRCVEAARVSNSQSTEVDGQKKEIGKRDKVKRNFDGIPYDNIEKLGAMDTLLSEQSLAVSLVSCYAKV